VALREPFGIAHAACRAGSRSANRLGDRVLQQRISERWSGWTVAAASVGSDGERADDWQSSAGRLAGLCSEKCGCVGDLCGVKGADGNAVDAGLDGGAGAVDGKIVWSATLLPAEPELRHADAGMSTVEYAVGTVVAAAFAAVLYKIVTGDSVVAGLTNLINSALSTSF
jgi:hypothetical protein